MIARIEGKLVGLEGDRGLIEVGSVWYEVFLAGYAVSELGGCLDTDVVLFTTEYYEGTPGGGNLIPRLVGFLSLSEKEFFERYTRVKGMGIRKGLKSLSIPIGTIAGAIEAGDDKILMSMPGIGKRMAQLILAELKGKLADFAVGEGVSSVRADKFDAFQTEALEILIAWGERRPEAMELLMLTCKKHPEIKSAEELVPLVYRVKQGIEV